MLVLQTEVADTKSKDLEEIWKPPQRGWAKLNFDASFREDSNSGAWRAVLRDEKGDTILSAWGNIEHCSSVEVAEAVAGLQGIKATLPNYAGPITVENDCAALVQELQGTGASKSTIAGIVKDIRSLLDCFSSYSIGKVKRNNNQVAHQLARLGNNVSDICVLSGSLPPCVVCFAIQDCNRIVYS
jgi:ribonuclease HI